MKHVAYALGLVVVLLTWLTPAVERALALAWPVLAVAVMVLASCAALSGSIWLVGKAVRSLHPLQPIEILPPDETQRSQWARSVPPGPHTPSRPQAVPRRIWDAMTVRYATIGELRRFNARDMVHDHTSRAGHDTYIKILKSGGVLRGDRGGTVWVGGWSLARLRNEIAELPLPYPAGSPPPVWWRKPDLSHTANTGRAENTTSTPGGLVVISPMRR